MGTRADFYIGRGKDAKWLGSIAWDGMPEHIPANLLNSKTKTTFIKRLKALETRDDWTSPFMGWPWPWDNSQTTDYAYAFDAGTVWASSFGHAWFDPLGPESDDADDEDFGKEEFPNMAEGAKVTYGKRSGVIIMGPQGVANNEE
jgi:hypothetical protein